MPEDTSFWDYLMTYGWALLLILVVAGILYFYGLGYNPEIPVSENQERCNKLASYLAGKEDNTKVSCFESGLTNSCLCKFYEEIEENISIFMKEQRYYFE